MEERVLNRIAIVTDTNSGILQEQAFELGVSVIPMPFMVDGKEYYEGVTLGRQKFYQALLDEANISTSQPSVPDVTEIWDKLLKEYDEIVHIPMSSGLSGSCATALMLAQEYDGKVEVVNNQRISVTQRQSVLDARMLADSGWSAAKIREKIEEEKYESTIYITLDTLKYLKKGGRITPAAAALGTILRIKPVLQIQGEKLDAFAKARTVNMAKTIMKDALKKDIETRFGNDPKNVNLAVAHTENEQAALELKKELQVDFPDNEILIAHLPLSISCHIGPGSLAVACSKKLEV